MQSLFLAAKLFCYALVTVVWVSFFPALALAQVYQIQPDGSLIYQPRYANPNFQQRNVVPPIYPGQIINGERVISASESTQPRSPTDNLSPPSPVSNPNRKNNKTIQDSPQLQQSQRRDKIPPTNLSIPAGPALQSEADAQSAPATVNTVSTDALPNQTPQKPESSIAKEEKTNPPQEKTPALAPPKPNESQGDESKEEVTLDPPKIDEDILAEIKQIRDQLGGGISETLKDVAPMPHFGPIEIESFQNASAATTDRKTSTQELFNEELRSVMSQQESNSSSVSEPPQAHSRASSSRQPQSNYTDRTQELRTCARELEQLAGRLETIQAYQHADQLRQQAAEIWMTARSQ